MLLLKSIIGSVLFYPNFDAGCSICDQQHVLSEPLCSRYAGVCMLQCRQFPRVGAYWACALKGSGDRVECILAADSLLPPGNGRPLSEQDR